MAKPENIESIERRPAQTVTYLIDGRPQRMTTRTFSLAFLAQRAIGGAGAAAKLRTLLTEAGIEDPAHTSWTLALPDGKTVGAVKDGDPLPEPAAEQAKPKIGRGKASERIATLNAHKSASKAARDAGHPIPDSALASMDAATAGKVERARRTRQAPPVAAAS